MAPYVPEEINVFSVPHSRMKELVNSYFDLIQSTNFSSTVDLELLLESLYQTFTEFKSHEQIENKLIVRKLRSKMRMLSVKNSAVCNCHKGSRLSEMIRLLEHGFNKMTDQDRINYGIKLRKELMEFTNDSFLPHMKEEEELFQPLLLKYFSYEELCHLKEKVIQQHLEKKEAQRCGLEKSVWADRETEESVASTSSESEEEEARAVIESRCQNKVSVKLSIVDLPPELVLKVFQFLSPHELCRCAIVCRRLNQMAMDYSLWRNILPIQWSKGNFSFVEAYHGDDGCEDSENEGEPSDEDADVDESEDALAKKMNQQVFSEVEMLDAISTYLLPKVGLAVEKLVLANGRMVTDKLVRKFLALCPNVKHIDLTQTNISDSALVSFGRQGFASNLTTLILSGCSKLTDASLMRLADCLERTKIDCEEDVEDFSMSCLLLCDQFYQMCKSHLGSKCHLMVSDEKKNGQCQSEQSCGKASGPGERSSETAVKLSNNMNGFCCGNKNMSSCSSMDSSESLRVQFGAKLVEYSVIKAMNCNKNNSMKNQKKCPGGESKTQDRSLEVLNLSGCFRFTDAGLNALFRSGRFPFLNYLDLSGCMRLTAAGLHNAVAACPSLNPSNLFYCDNIVDGPYPDEASGCRNLECSNRACCRSGN